MVDRQKTPLEHAAAYGSTFREKSRELSASASAEELRRMFCRPLPDRPVDGTTVINDLIAAAEPGLIGNTDPNFFAWVMGSSDPVGVAADWLTSVWGQNAAIFQTSPAAAIAEEAVSNWLLDLLELPRDSSVGLVTGATMAGFVSLAAARLCVLERAGHDFGKLGLQGAPMVQFYLSDDVHACNIAAIRYLGFGDANIVRVPSDRRGLMDTDHLEVVMARSSGPKIIIAQAGHINSGGFEDFKTISRLSHMHDAWLHIDGAFGLWARALPEKSYLTLGLERADSWSVDGHKWLQIPYDSGFAIIRDTDAHRRAMDISGGYLNQSPTDGRNPTEFNPELSRRARGFAAWAVLRALGREGVRDLVRGHCLVASQVSQKLADIPDLEIITPAELNQVVFAPLAQGAEPDPDEVVSRLVTRLNADHGVFIRQASWKGRSVIRLSLISAGTQDHHGDNLVRAIAEAWTTVKTELGITQRAG